MQNNYSIRNVKNIQSYLHKYECKVPFLSAIESKKHHGASEPGPHFTNET